MPTNDNRHAYSGATRGVADRFNRTKMGKAARRSGYVTPETVTMWAAYVVTVLCNLLFEATRLGGTTSGEVANLMYVWFMPAGYVFSIWGLIYVALIVWLVQYTRDAPNRVRRFGFVALLFVVSCALNVAWLALFHFLQVYVGLFVIAALWAVMAALYVTVRRTMKTAAGRVPISIYAAWVTVAVVANLTTAITWAFDGGIPVLNELSTLLLVAGVLTVGYVMYKRFDDLAFPLVILWAVIGVGVHVAAASVLVAIAVFLLAAFGALVTFAPMGKLRASFRPAPLAGRAAGSPRPRFLASPRAGRSTLVSLPRFPRSGEAGPFVCLIMASWSPYPTYSLHAPARFRSRYSRRKATSRWARPARSWRSWPRLPPTSSASRTRRAAAATAVPPPWWPPWCRKSSTFPLWRISPAATRRKRRLAPPWPT